MMRARATASPALAESFLSSVVPRRAQTERRVREETIRKRLKAYLDRYLPSNSFEGPKLARVLEVEFNEYEKALNDLANERDQAVAILADLYQHHLQDKQRAAEHADRLQERVAALQVGLHEVSTSERALKTTHSFFRIAHADFVLTSRATRVNCTGTGSRPK